MLILIVIVVFIGSLINSLPVCQYTADGTLKPGQQGCYNLFPVFQWIEHRIISIFLVFMIAFLPLFLQGKVLLFDFYKL